MRAASLPRGVETASIAVESLPLRRACITGASGRPGVGGSRAYGVGAVADEAPRECAGAEAAGTAADEAARDSRS